MNAQTPSPDTSALPSKADAVRMLLALQKVAVSDAEAQTLAKTLERLAPKPETAP